MEKDPTNHNVIKHNKAKAVYRKERLHRMRSSWHENTASLNLEKETTKLWQLVKSLNEDNCKRTHQGPIRVPSGSHQGPIRVPSGENCSQRLYHKEGRSNLGERKRGQETN